MGNDCLKSLDPVVKLLTASKLQDAGFHGAEQVEVVGILLRCVTWRMF